MDRLWSPWRSQYVETAHNVDTCFLCEAHQTDKATSDNLLLARTEQVVVVLNRFPYNAGHLLVAPRDHVGSFASLSPSISRELMLVMQWATRVVEAELRPHGINIGANLGVAAGAGVPDHLHFHVVPRWTGDSNFMPVVGEVKVIAHALEQMRETLSRAFERHPYEGR